MRFRQSVHILALLIILACCVQPVLADDATTYYNIGEAYLAEGDYERAIASFNQALASDTSMIKMSGVLLYTYRDKSYAQIQLRNYDEAMVTLEQGLSLYPEDTMLWNNKGFTDYSLGKYKEALAAYNNALRYEPDYTIALVNKGDTLSKMEDYPGAVDAYTRALETDPGNLEAKAGLSSAQKAAAASAAASTTAPALSAANESRAVQFYNEGVNFTRLGQYAEAIVAFDRAIALNPDVTGAHLAREIALEKQRQAQQTTATPVQQQTPATPFPPQTQQPAQQPTRTTPLMYAPAGALFLMAGIALWMRHKEFF